ncbi:MAG: DinB family protein [Anaerolineae bacterium]
MNADAFRHFYDYHFNENRTMWENYIMPLTQAQFTEPVHYSQGSVRNQVVHMMSVDDAWFSDLRGVEVPEPLDPAQFDDRQIIRAYWDRVEQNMRAYLLGLTDAMLTEKPFPPGEDENLILWQVLLHVVNHGTDHRAQLLRILHDLGVKTVSQDYIFYVYEHP